MFAEPDPYGYVTLGSIRKKGVPLSKMTDEVWHETFLLYVLYFKYCL